MSATEQALVRELKTWWTNLNVRRFEGRLRPPVIEVSTRRGDLGRWTPATRTLSVSWALVADRPWGEVIAVLEHEMAHQYVHEVLGIHDETAHGPAFRAVCAERGIDARAAGAPVPTSDVERGVVRRIRKLLALADSPVEAEARAAAAKAWRLMLKHHVALAEAQAPRRYVTRQIGEVSARRPRHEQLLAGLLGSHFFVEVTLVPAFDVERARRGRAVEVAGTPEDVELALWVWDYVLETAERLWRAHRRQHRIGSDRDRRRYLEGVMLGFREQLEGTAREVEETGLVYVGDPGLDDFVGARYGRRRKGRRFSLGMDASRQAGRAAGRGLRLRRPVAERGGPGGLLERKDR